MSAPIAEATDPAAYVLLVLILVVWPIFYEFGFFSTLLHAGGSRREASSLVASEATDPAANGIGPMQCAPDADFGIFAIFVGEIRSLALFSMQEQERDLSETTDPGADVLLLLRILKYPS